jgi:hypothetical protein
MKGLLVGLAVLVGLAGAVEARMHHPYRGHRIVPVASGPIDTFATPSGAYSFRKLRSAYAGPAVHIRRASDNLETDINFLGYVPGLGSPWDEAAANAHCASTNCFVVTLYDQSGNARHLTQPTAASQPQLIFSCQGALPCLQAVELLNLNAASVTPATGVGSFSAVGIRTAGVGLCAFIRQNGNNNRLQAYNANLWRVAGGASGFVAATATDNVWHAAQGVINGAASVLNIDGAETAGTTTGNVTAGLPGLSGATTTTCRYGEAVFWDNYALTSGERTALAGNQRSFWGTP